MAVKVAPDSTLGRRERTTWVNAVSPGWFDTYGMRLLAGRDVDATDRAEGPAVAVVNQAFATRFLKPGNPVGQQFSPGDGSGDAPVYEVVGLVPDAVYRSLRAEMTPIAYIPLAQWKEPSPEVVISIRSAGAPPGDLAKSVTAALVAAEPRLAVSYHPLRKQVDAALVQERLLANMSVFFGGLALLLAGLGLYGVTSYAVNSRRTEIGIRMALGATAAAVVRLVLRRVAWLVLIGITAGSALSLWATRFVGSLLYGLEPQDPASLAAAALLLALAGTLAGWLPARRAARTDPTIVLREG
jgi:predicted permease